MSQLLDLERMHVYEVGGTLVYQLLCGRDLEGEMSNFVYLVVNAQDQTAIAVDAAWDLEALYGFAAKLRVRLVGAVYTHGHADHVGGPGVPGCAEVSRRGTEVWAGEHDAADIRKQCGLRDAQLRELRDGDVLPLGGLGLHVLHTPGHTPGSICVLLTGAGALTPRGGTPPDGQEIRVPVRGGLLISGDTMFVGGHGRTDLRESNHDHMLQSLLRLTELPLDTVVLPGHNYDPLAYTTIDVEKGGCGAVAGARMRGIQWRPLPGCCCAGACGPQGWRLGQRLELVEGEHCESGAIAIVEGWSEAEQGYAVRVLQREGTTTVSIVAPERLRKRKARDLGAGGEARGVLYRVVHGTILRREDPVASGTSGGKIAKSRRAPGSIVHSTGRSWTGAQGTTWIEVDTAHDQRGGWLASHGKCFGIDAELLRLEPNDPDAQP
mmetsp:Transcript_18572/g.37843  ORF Transcript_18572/g.37843 Transcript_18572/m.37843 type:complete len:436 (+) Transcript_18572:68-1375(+)